MPSKNYFLIIDPSMVLAGFSTKSTICISFAEQARFCVNLINSSGLHSLSRAIKPVTYDAVLQKRSQTMPYFKGALSKTKIGQQLLNKKHTILAASIIAL